MQESETQTHFELRGMEARSRRRASLGRGISESSNSNGGIGMGSDPQWTGNHDATLTKGSRSRQAWGKRTASCLVGIMIGGGVFYAGSQAGRNEVMEDARTAIAIIARGAVRYSTRGQQQQEPDGDSYYRGRPDVDFRMHDVSVQKGEPTLQSGTAIPSNVVTATASDLGEIAKEIRDSELCGGYGYPDKAGRCHFQIRIDMDKFKNVKCPITVESDNERDPQALKETVITCWFDQLPDQHAQTVTQ